MPQATALITQNHQASEIHAHIDPSDRNVSRQRPDLLLLSWRIVTSERRQALIALRKRVSYTNNVNYI